MKTYLCCCFVFSPSKFQWDRRANVCSSSRDHWLTFCHHFSTKKLCRCTFTLICKGRSASDRSRLCITPSLLKRHQIILKKTSREGKHLPTHLPTILHKDFSALAHGQHVIITRRLWSRSVSIAHIPILPSSHICLQVSRSDLADMSSVSPRSEVVCQHHAVTWLCGAGHKSPLPVQEAGVSSWPRLMSCCVFSK